MPPSCLERNHLNEPRLRGFVLGTLPRAQARQQTEPHVAALGLDELGDADTIANRVERSESIISWTKGAFTEQTADSVLVWETYQSPMHWDFWYAVKDGRAVGSGNWDSPRD